MAFDLKCKSCYERHIILFDRDDYYAWKRGSKTIQDAFPYLSDGERELMLSGICSDCFDSMFGE